MIIDEKIYTEIIHKIFNEALKNKNESVIDEYFAKDVVVYDGKLTLHGSDALKKNIIDRHQAIPDLTYVLDDFFISGNKAAFRWHGIGNATMDFADFKAGKSVKYWGLSVCEVKDGKIIKNWETSTAIDAVPQG